MADFKKLLKYVTTRAKEDDLEQEILLALDEGVSNWNKIRERTASGAFSVSKLGKCIRQLYYEAQTPSPPFSPAVLKRFRGGIDTGQRLLNYGLHAGTLFGIYVCKACGFRCNTFTRITCCGECGSHELAFPEIGIRDLSVGKGISGKMDMLFLSTSGKVRITEIKAASSNYRVAVRENVEKKLRGYIQQGNMYVGLLRRFKRRVEKGLEHGIIFYEDIHGEVIDGLVLTQRMDLSSFALIFEDKNSMENYVHEFIYDHDMYLDDRRRVKLYFDCLLSGTLPPREVTQECRYCFFKSDCDSVKVKKKALWQK